MDCYIRVNDQIVGPLSEAALIELAEEGRVTEQTIVTLRGGDAERQVAAGKIKGLREHFDSPDVCKWFIKQQGKTSRLLTTDALRRAASRGKVTPDTLIRRWGQDWTKASDVDVLAGTFDSAKHPVEKPPDTGHPDNDAAATSAGTAFTDDDVLAVLGDGPQPRPQSSAGLIRWNCPHCGAAITVSRNSVAKKCRCPGCGEISRPSNEASAPIGRATEQTLSLTEYEHESDATKDAEAAVLKAVGSKSSNPVNVVEAFFGLLGLVVTCSLFFTCCIWFPFLSGGPSNGTSGSHSPTEHDAELMARRCVRESLTSPGSASFGWESPSIVRSGNTFTVSGKVESKNAFGVMIQHRFTCRVRFVGSGNWTCESAEFH